MHPTDFNPGKALISEMNNYSGFADGRHSLALFPVVWVNVNVAKESTLFNYAVALIYLAKSIYQNRKKYLLLSLCASKVMCMCVPQDIHLKC